MSVEKQRLNENNFPYMIFHFSFFIELKRRDLRRKELFNNSCQFVLIRGSDFLQPAAAVIHEVTLKNTNHVESVFAPRVSALEGKSLFF